MKKRKIWLNKLNPLMKMNFDSLYKTTLTHFCYCIDTPQSMIYESIQNRSATNKLYGYCIGFGKHIDVKHEDVKDNECVRVLDPKWIDEIINTTRSEAFKKLTTSL